MATDTVHEPEVVDDGPNALALRRPNVPVTATQLAAQGGEGVAIFNARAEILNTARSHAIRVTHPEDWVLYKSPDDRTVGYLEDAGCERVRPIFSISIFDIEEPTKVLADDGKSFAIITRGRGRCGLTLDAVDGAEGIRESTDDFVKDLHGIKKEMRVRQASRANLDGRIVRELAGLGSVPVDELARVWQGTEKNVEHCRKGRGFGSQDERHGGTKEGAPNVTPPECPHCKIPLVFRSAKKAWGCKNYESHKDKRVWIEHEDWIKELELRKAPKPAEQTASTTKPAAAKPAAAAKPVHADDIFGRQPGEDG